MLGRTSTTLPSRVHLKEQQNLIFCGAFRSAALQPRPTSTLAQSGAWKVPYCALKFSYCHRRPNNYSCQVYLRAKRQQVSAALFLFSAIFHHFALGLIELFTNLTIFLLMCHKMWRNFIKRLHSNLSTRCNRKNGLLPLSLFSVFARRKTKRELGSGPKIIFPTKKNEESVRPEA